MAVLCAPNEPVSEICGKKAALATPDVGVGGDQIFFRAAHVGPALQQRRRQSGRHFGQVGLVHQAEPARYVARVSAQQDADIVLGLLRSPAAG